MARVSMDLPTGVELRSGAIRIRFTWGSKRCSETLPYPATKEGIATASRLRDQVVSLNKLGLLDITKYAELFPNSINASTAVDNTFGGYTQTWLNGRSLTAGTRDNYKSALNKWWMPNLATLPLNTITPALIRKLLGQIPFTSEGVRASAMTKLRTILKAAVSDELLPKHPMQGMEKPRLKKKVVDPFTAADTENILQAMKKDPLMYPDFMEFIFFSGMRLSEVMALRWTEIDFQKKTAYVCRIVSKGKIEERTKTNKFRHVLLTPQAIQALKRSQQRSVSVYCFPTHRDNSYIAQVSTLHCGWAVLLASLGLRHRPPYNARHTYATKCLMAGMKPGFIANQLGHSVEILLTTYARWLNAESDWDEMQKLESAPKLPQGSEDAPKSV